MTSQELQARILRSCDVESGSCWRWKLAKDRDGYGQMKHLRRMTGAHRVAYQAFVGPIPDGMVIDHLCFQRDCVNPAHLRVLDRILNLRRQRKALGSRCPNGHEYTPENLYLTPEGGRRCRICRHRREREYQARRRAAQPRPTRPVVDDAGGGS